MEIRQLVRRGLEQFGLYYSIYPGFVVETQDPKDMNRVLLKIPLIHGTGSGVTWALPVGFPFGKGYGFQYTPQVGEQVWVQFEHGNVRKPLWSGGYPYKGAKPEELQGKKIGLKTPQGNLIVINEDDAEITIKTNDGTIILNDGAFEGLVKVGELTNRLNAIEDKLNTTITAIKTHIHTGGTVSGSTGTPSNFTTTNMTKTQQSDIENEKVKH